jgi:L-ribulokinase
MKLVAGVDFGTLSVRVSIYDKERGERGRATAEYSVQRSPTDPDLATQRPFDQMDALVNAMRGAISVAGVDGRVIKSVALDTTGSSVIIVGNDLKPLSDYYLWCDHRASNEATEITAAARAWDLGKGFEGLVWCGGVYSSEWGWSKLLHWLRNNPTQRSEWSTALENCDMIAATLCGITDVTQLPRSVCAMGHKWMWNPRWGGLPPEELLVSIDPLLRGARAKISGCFQTSDRLAGFLNPTWASKLGLAAGIPIPTGALDAHWDAVGANIRVGKVVNVVGTSTCIIGLSKQERLVPGVCGVVPGSVAPSSVGVEAGLSAVGDIFNAIAKRAKQPVAELAEATKNYSAGQTGLLRMTWDNGDRTVLVNPDIGGITFGWNLAHTSADEFHAAVEGTAMHTRVILERMEEHGTVIKQVINSGGIPMRNARLNQIYANFLNKPIVVPDKDSVSLGAVIFAFLAAGEFESIEEAQNALCPTFTTYIPEPRETERAEQLYRLFRKIYFSFGVPNSAAADVGDILPELRRISRLGVH